MIGFRSLFKCPVLALTVALVACGDGDSAGNRQSPTAGPGDATALTVTAWVDQVCALAVEAADALGAAGAVNPEAMSLEERKQRAAEVLTPLAEALGVTAQDLAGLHPPEPAGEFHEALQTTMADISSAWLDLVDAADRAESSDQIDAANATFIQAQDNADAKVIAAYQSLDAEVTAALSRPEDCGILNEIRS